MPPATHIDELRFLRTLTPPPPTSSPSDEDSASDESAYDPYRSPTPENRTGVVFDGEDCVWRCVFCGWEVETVDGVQGVCGGEGGHRSDLTRVDGWFSTCEWDVGMWSDQGGEDGSFDGNEGRSEDEWIFLLGGEEGDGGVGGVGGEGEEGEEEGESEDDCMEDFIVDDDGVVDGGGGVVGGEGDGVDGVDEAGETVGKGM